MAALAKQPVLAEHSDAGCCGKALQHDGKNQPVTWRRADGTCIVLYCIEIFYMKQLSWQ